MRFTTLIGLMALAPGLAVGGPLTDRIEGGPDTPYHITPAWDGGLIALDLAVLNGLKWVVDHPHEDGDRDDLWAIDDKIVDWGRNDDALRSSDIGAMMAVAFGVVDSAITGKHDGPTSGVVKFVIYAESALTTSALTEISKQLVQRPRPCTYQADRRYRDELNCRRTDNDAYLSFWSGHTATTAALSATATYFAFREEDSGTRGALTLAGGLALTSFVAVERMRAGKHFPTDVLTGFAVGATVGVLVPHLHLRSGSGSGTGASVASDGQVLMVSGRF